MRRRMIIFGSAVLLAVIATVLTIVLLRSREPVVTGPPGPTFAPGELTPEETTVVAMPRPDGTVLIEQTLVFDAGPGLDRPLGLYLGGTRIGWQSSERTAQYGVVPVVSDLRAREAGAATDLAIEVTEEPNQRPLSAARRYALVPPASWSPGRHVVEVSFVLDGVWVRADGVRALVLPLRFAYGPGGGQPADLTRVRITGATQLQCPATNVNFADRRACGKGGSFFRFEREYTELEAVLVIDPAGVTADPIPVTEQRR